MHVSIQQNLQLFGYITATYEEGAGRCYDKIIIIEKIEIDVSIQFLNVLQSVNKVSKKL